MGQQEVARNLHIIEEVSWLKRIVKPVGADVGFTGPKAFSIIKGVFKIKNLKLGVKMHIYL